MDSPGNPDETIGAAILAAGMSQRMGSAKALLDLDGRPLVCHLLSAIRQVDQIQEVAVVTGHDPHPIHQALAGMNVSLIHNQSYATGGMISSVQAAVAALMNRCAAMFILLLDQPLIKATTLDALAGTWKRGHRALVIPSYRREHGHPILLATSSASAILSLPRDATLRDFVHTRRDDSVVVEVDDPGVVEQLDTPQDYQRIVRLFRSQSCPTEKPV